MRAGPQLQSLNQPPHALPSIEEGRCLDHGKPLPGLKPLPVLLPATTGEGSTVQQDAGAGAPGHGGSGPGVEGSLSARTYFRQHHERLLMRTEEVRNFESAELAFLASCRLRKHFQQAATLTTKDAASQDPVRLAGADTNPPPRDREFKWLEAALEGTASQRLWLYVYNEPTCMKTMPLCTRARP